MTLATFDFEKPIVELERQIEDFESRQNEPGISRKIKALEQKLEKMKIEIYSNLTPWQRVQLARHMARPHSLDYIQAIFTEWTEIYGDRGIADDRAVVTGFGHFGEQSVTIIGQQKGKDTKENLARNFGMMHPEGYRKAMRVMRMGEKFNLPIIIFIDTPGAYPGIGAEERGQAEAIARNIRDMFTLTVPILIIIIGEGASGGALGIGVGDMILMMENAWYCVISPEGCASILWRDRAMAARSAEALKLTAPDLLKLGVIDEIVSEPLGGAHRDPAATFQTVREVLQKHLLELIKIPKDALMEKRAHKYRNMGIYLENQNQKEERADHKQTSGKKRGRQKESKE